MSRSGRAAAVAATLALALGLAGPVLAHGPAPAALRPLDTDSASLSAVQLSVGAASLGDDGAWYFVCPALWGAPETPLMAAGGGSLWAASDDGLVELDPRRAHVDAIVEGVDSASTAALGDDDAGAWALVFDETGSALWAPGDTSAPRFSSSERWTTLATDGGEVVIGRVDGDELVVLGVGRDGRSGDELRYALSGTAAPSLRAAGGRRFAVVAAGSESHLYELGTQGARELVGGEGAIHGPFISARGLPVAVVDGVLGVVDGEDWTVIDDTRRYTCLVEVDGVALACAQEEIWRVDAEGRPQEVVFDVLWLAGTLPALARSEDAELRAVCGSEWADFAGHAGIERRLDRSTEVSGDVGPSAAPEGEGEGGCGVAPPAAGAGGGWWLAALAAGLTGRRRRGRRQGRRQSSVPPGPSAASPPPPK